MSAEVTDAMADAFIAEMQKPEWTNRWATMEGVKAGLKAAALMAPGPLNALTLAVGIPPVRNDGVVTVHMDSTMVYLSPSEVREHIAQLRRASATAEKRMVQP